MGLTSVGVASGSLGGAGRVVSGGVDWGVCGGGSVGFGGGVWGW